MIDFINQIADSWLKYFGIAVVQNTIFIAVIFLTLKFAKELPAKIKYAISLIALFKLLIPPFIPVHFQQIITQTVSNTTSNTEGEFVGGMVGTTEFTSSGMLFVFWASLIFLYLSTVFIITIYYQFRANIAIKNVSVSSHYPKIKLCESSFVSTPMSLGLFPRKIYLPDNWQELPEECHDIMLHHEYAHIRHYDGVFQFFQNIVQAIYFFHPLVWMLNKSINEYREMACDDYAVKGSQLSPVKFSRYLVQIAETISLNRWNTISASALIKQKNLLLNRINYQVKEQCMKKVSKTKTRWIFLVVILLMVPLSLYSRITVKLENEEPLLAVVSTGKIYGKVIDKGTGKGISGATISLKGYDREVKTDANGKYYFIGLEADKYKVLARNDGYIKALVIADVVGGKSTELNFKLKKAIDPPPPPPTEKEKLSRKEKELKQKQMKIEKKEQLLKQKELDKEKVKRKVKEKKLEKQQYQQQKEHSEPTIIGGMKELQKYVKYPQSAKNDKIEGEVYVKALIAETGKVKKAKVVKSLTRDCDKSALKAIYSVKFKPAMKDGVPKEVWITVPVKFKLSD